MTVSQFRKKEPRAKAEMEAICYADPILFLSFDDMPKAAQKEFSKHGSIPCEGGGVPGEWCRGCRFGGVETVEVEILKRAEQPA